MSEEEDMAQTFQDLCKKFTSERDEIQQRIQLLGVGEKSTNIEVQLQKTLQHYNNRIAALEKFLTKKGKK